MAWTAQYEVKIPMPPLKIRTLLRDAFKNLGWEYLGEIDGRKWNAHVGWNWRSWGERVTVEVDGVERLVLRSRCNLKTQCIDWGKNRRNIHRLRSIIESFALAG